MDTQYVQRFHEETSHVKTYRVLEKHPRSDLCFNFMAGLVILLPPPPPPGHRIPRGDIKHRMFGLVLYKCITKLSILDTVRVIGFTFIAQWLHGLMTKRSASTPPSLLYRHDYIHSNIPNWILDKLVLKSHNIIHGTRINTKLVCFQIIHNEYLF